LDRLGAILLESSTPCYAWSLLSNHAHFLLRTGNIPLSSLMRKLLTGYAVTFNRRYHRDGHLFQNRYKSVLCEEDVYLKELVRYIHLNPLRAGLVGELRELGSYDYSGHCVLMGKRKREWQDSDYVLRYFGERQGQARRNYLSFVSKGVGEGSRPDLVGGGLLRSVGGWTELKDLRDSGERVRGDERILGGSAFVERVLRESEEEWEKRALLRKRSINLERLIEKLAGHFGVNTEDLRSASKARAVAKARAVLCLLGTRRLGLTSAFIAKELGISPSAVTKSLGRGREILEHEAIEDNLLECQ
jgi:putative transposase